MKKRVTVVTLFVIITLFLIFKIQTFTGLQTLDLPAPPSPPGMAADQVTPTPTYDYDAECGDGFVDSGEDCESDSDCYSGEECRNCQCVGLSPTQDAEDILGADVPSGNNILDRLAAIEQKILALDLLPGFESRLNVAEAQAAQAANFASRLDGMDSRIDGLDARVRNLEQRPTPEFPAFDRLESLVNSSRKNTILSILLSVFVLLIIISLVSISIVQRRTERVDNKRLIRQYLTNYQNAGYKLDTLRMHLRACGWNDKFIEEVVKELPK